MGERKTRRGLVRREMGRVDGDGIFCAIRGVARSLQLRKSMASSSIHQRELVCDTTTSTDEQCRAVQ